MNVLFTALTRHHCKIWIFTVLLTPVAPTIAATLVIESFGPGNTYDTSGFLIGTSDYSELAIGFSVPGSAPLKVVTIQIAAQNLSGTPTQLNVQIRADADGSPGQIIDSISFTNITNQPGGQVLTGTSNQMPVLSTAGRYWISASAPTLLPEAEIGWFSPPSNALPRPAADRILGGSWELIDESSNLGVFRITGIVIPEPTSILLVVSSLSLLVLGRI
jgi:hypothetical protein